MASNSSNSLELKTSTTPVATEMKEEKKKKKKKNNEEETKTLNASPPDQLLTIPTFIQLFIMSRLLKKCFPSQSKNRVWRDGKQLGNLAKLLKNEKNISQAQVTLTKLLKLNICEFMKQWYLALNNKNKKKRIILINEMFNTIIVEKFSKEYQALMTYPYQNNSNKKSKNKNKSKKKNESKKKKTKNQYYQSMVFNMTDIMCSIFQYLDLMKNKRGECVLSYVNSHWLYHSWNPNSFYYTQYFSHLVDSTMKLKWNNKKMKKDKTLQIEYISIIHQWQRMIKIRKINFSTSYSAVIPNKLILNKFNTLKNVECIDVRCQEKHFPMVETLFDNCRNKILSYKITITRGNSYVRCKKVNTLSPIEFNNVKSVCIDQFFVPVVWSNKCEILNLDFEFIDVNKEWCNMMIQHCDCSGIKTLDVCVDKFVQDTDEKDKDKDKDNKTKPVKNICHQDWLSLWNKLAIKFTSLENLNIKVPRYGCSKIHEYLLSFWGIVNVNCKNRLTVNLIGLNEKNDFEMIRKRIEQGNCDIKFIDFRFFRGGLPSKFDSTIKPIVEKPSIEKITLDTYKSSAKFLKLFNFTLDINNCKYNYDGKFSSLKMIKISEHSRETKLKDINDFLTCDLVLKGEIFLDLHIGCGSNDKNTDNMTSLFELFCQNIFDLIVKQIAINVYIQFQSWASWSEETGPNLQINQCSGIFDSIFAKNEMSKEYKQPKWNEYCTANDCVKKSFSIADDETDYGSPTRISVSNARAK